MTANRVVTVHIAHQNMDLKNVQTLVANLMKQVGHTGCFSGFDINFRHEIEFAANLTGEVKGIAGLGIG